MVSTQSKRPTQRPPGAPSPETAVGTREWYDFVALVTDAVPVIHVGGTEATQTLLALLNLSASDHVLDVGCGPGGTPVLIASETGARVTGVDLSEAMVAKAMERAARAGLQDRLDFQVGDVLNLDFADGSFDAAVFESFLTIIPCDPGDALAEITRVVRAGGFVAGNEAVVDPDDLADLRPLLDEHPAIRRTYTPESLRARFETAGPEVVEMQTAVVEGGSGIDVSRGFKDLGCRGLLSFFVKTYPRLVWKLLSDPRFRRAQQVDEQVTKAMKVHAAYALVVARKPV